MRSPDYETYDEAVECIHWMMAQNAELKAEDARLRIENEHLRKTVYDGPHVGAKFATDAMVQMHDKIESLEKDIRHLHALLWQATVGYDKDFSSEDARPYWYKKAQEFFRMHPED